MGAKFVRDPEAKRQAVIEAAAQLLLEVGPSGLTHRTIAARAGVSVGTTTNLFDTKKDIEVAAITFLSRQRADAVASLEERMAAAPHPEEVLARHLFDCMCMETTSSEILAYMAVHVNDPRAADYVQGWYEVFYRSCARFASETQARAVANYCDGLFVQHAIRNAPRPTYAEILYNLRLLLELPAGGAAR